MNGLGSSNNHKSIMLCTMCSCSHKHLISRPIIDVCVYSSEADTQAWPARLYKELVSDTLDTSGYILKNIASNPPQCWYEGQYLLSNNDCERMESKLWETKLNQSQNNTCCVNSLTFNPHKEQCPLCFVVVLKCEAALSCKSTECAHTAADGETALRQLQINSVTLSNPKEETIGMKK